MGRWRIKNASVVLYCMLWLLLLCGVAAAEIPRVAIINSYHHEMDWVREHNGVIKRGLGPKAVVDTYYIDFKRQSDQGVAQNVKRIKKICSLHLPDAVVLTDDYAVKVFASYFVDKGVPVVFLGVNGNIRNYIDNAHAITGVFERPLVKRSITHLRAIMGPSLKRCLVAMDDSMSSRVFMKETMKDSFSFELSGVHTDIRLLKNFSEWKQAVKTSKAKGYDAIVIGTYHIFKDEKGRHIESKDVLLWTSKHAPLPLFALWDFSVGNKMALGGYVISGIDQGREALKLLRRVLAGEKPRDINPVIGKTGMLFFSNPEMKRWNIELPREFLSKGYLIRIIR